MYFIYHILQLPSVPCRRFAACKR